MTEYEGDSTLLANSTINRLDTRRNDGLNQTSLDVLNKKGHRTQIQKQFQEFGKQQIYQQQQHQQHQQHQQKNGFYSNNMYCSKSTMSFKSQSSLPNQHHIQQQQQGNFEMYNPGAYANPKLANSQASFNSNSQGFISQGQWFRGNDLSNEQDSQYDGFSNYTATPDLNRQSGNWGNDNEIIRELETENQMLMEDIQKFQEFRELNEVLIEENEILREKLSILKENTEVGQTNKTQGDSLKFQQLNEEVIRLKQINEQQYAKIENFDRERESFELQLESMAQEITKLKLLNIENKKAKDKQIENLKSENEELTKELDVFYHKEESSLTSLESTPKSSTITPSSSTTANSDFVQSFKLPSQVQRTPPQPQSKTFPTMNTIYTNEELINDLLMTIRQLKSDNEVLLRQKENVTINLARQKKFVKKFIDNRPHGKVKLRNGLNILETVDILV